MVSKSNWMTGALPCPDPSLRLVLILKPIGDNWILRVIFAISELTWKKTCQINEFHQCSTIVKDHLVNLSESEPFTSLLQPNQEVTIHERLTKRSTQRIRIFKKISHLDNSRNSPIYCRIRSTTAVWV